MTQATDPAAPDAPLSHDPNPNTAPAAEPVGGAVSVLSYATAAPTDRLDWPSTVLQVAHRAVTVGWIVLLADVVAAARRWQLSLAFEIALWLGTAAVLCGTIALILAPAKPTRRSGIAALAAIVALAFHALISTLRPDARLIPLAVAALVVVFGAGIVAAATAPPRSRSREVAGLVLFAVGLHLVAGAIHLARIPH